MAEKTLATFCRESGWLLPAAKRAGLLNGLPICHGGSGLPTLTLSTDCKVRKYRVLLLGETFKAPSLLRGEIDPCWSMASMMSELDMGMFFEDGTFVTLPEGSERPPDSQGAPYVLGGSLRSLKESCASELFSDLLFSMGPQKPYRPRVSEATLARVLNTWLGTLPPLPEGVNLNILPIPQNNEVWIRRTFASDGTLLFPRWVGETRASEATVRASLYREVLISSSGSSTGWLKPGLSGRSTSDPDGP